MKKGCRRCSPAAFPLGCLGSFQSQDPICRSYCAIRIRCLIERDQAIYLGGFEEPAEGDDQQLTFQ